MNLKDEKTRRELAIKYQPLLYKIANQMKLKMPQEMDFEDVIGYGNEGIVKRNAQIRLVRDGIVSHEGVISSLRRFKDDVREVAAGYECGLGIEKYNDIKPDDVIECFNMVEVKR